MWAISWNLRLFGETLGGIADVHDQDRACILADWLAEFAASNQDVGFLFLQEVWDDRMAILLSDRLAHAFPYSARLDGGGLLVPDPKQPDRSLLGNGLLLLSAHRLDQTTLARIPLSSPSGSFESLTTRCALVVETAQAPRVLACNLHLHSTPDKAGSLFRKRQIQQLVADLEDRFVCEGRAMRDVALVGGDWNEPDHANLFRQAWMDGSIMDGCETACDARASRDTIDGFVTVIPHPELVDAAQSVAPPAGDAAVRELSDHTPTLAWIDCAPEVTPRPRPDDVAWPSASWTEAKLRARGLWGLSLWSTASRHRRVATANSWMQMVFRAGELELDRMGARGDQNPPPIARGESLNRPSELVS